MSTDRQGRSFKEGSPAEFLVGIFFFLFGTLVIYEAGKLQQGTLHAPGPGFFPFWLGCLVALLSLLVLIGLWLKKVKVNRGQWQGLLWQKVAFSSLVLFAYALALEHIGYPVSTCLLLLILLRLIEKKNILLVIGLAVFISLGTYYLFRYWLLIQLPKGILPL